MRTMSEVLRAHQNPGETATACLYRLKKKPTDTITKTWNELMCSDEHVGPICAWGDGSGTPTPTPPLIPETTYSVTLGEDTSKLIRGYKDPASAVGGFGSIDKTAFGPSVIFAIEFRHDVVDPKNEFDEIEVILKDANPAITEVNIVVEGEVITLADGNSNNKTFYQHSVADPRIATIYAAIMAKTLGSAITVDLSAV